MVNKQHYRHYIEGPPPPMDESWWEAVLTEEQEDRLPVKDFFQNLKPAQQLLVNSQSKDDGFYEPFTDIEEELDSTDWGVAKTLYKQDQAVELIVIGFNRGGLLVKGEHLQGFVPISHLISTPCAGEDVDSWLGSYKDRRLNLKIIECDQERGRVVLSERAAQSEPGSRNILLTSLSPGKCAIGTVTNITDFGIFVDLGGVEGLVHISEISWGRVHHPAMVVSLGQQIQVYVIHVDQEKARIALSLKRLHSNPWDTAEQRYFPGQVTEATVTSIVPFGAFACLEEGLDGLIHMSKFGNSDSFNRSENGTLREGQRVQVRVLHVDASKQRIGLGLKIDED